MKIALCTTTIHVPHALKLMRKCSPDVKFFVALDKNSDFNGIVFHMENDDRESSWLTPDWQEQHWQCSKTLGWQTLSRRNIAFLEALKWGADVIYSWDNDNLAIGTDHFDLIERLFCTTRLTQSSRLVDGLMQQINEPWKFNGIKVDGYAYCWFDPGSLLIPATRHRGFPHSLPAQRKSEPVIDAKVGIAAGLIIGNPDVDASTRIELKPDIAQAHLLAQAGIVVDPHTWTVFNTQNTAVIRELVPAWFLMPGVGRHDDIYASLIVQRVARERGLHVHFGPPFCYQQRNEHNLITDLRAEIDGMETVEKLADLLDHIQLPAKSVIEDTRIIYEQLTHCSFIPEKSAHAGLVWLEDIEGVL